MSPIDLGLYASLNASSQGEVYALFGAALFFAVVGTVLLNWDAIMQRMKGAARSFTEQWARAESEEEIWG